VSKDRGKAILKASSMGKRLMIIELENTSEVRRNTYREGKHSVAGTSNLWVEDRRVS